MIKNIPVFFLILIILPFITKSQNLKCDYDSIVIKVVEKTCFTKKYSYTITHQKINVVGKILFNYKVRKEEHPTPRIFEERIRSYSLENDLLLDSVNNQSYISIIISLAEQIVKQRQNYNTCLGTTVYEHPNKLVDISFFKYGNCINNNKIWEDMECGLPVECKKLIEILNIIKESNELLFYEEKELLEF